MLALLLDVFACGSHHSVDARYAMAVLAKEPLWLRGIYERVVIVDVFLLLVKTPTMAIG